MPRQIPLALLALLLQAATALAQLPPKSAAPAQQGGPIISVDPPCPDNLTDRHGDPAPLTCTCRPEQMMSGAVWGTDAYTDDSAVCRAALHAGALPRQGGTVTLLPEGPRQVWAGTTRNGVESQDYGPWPAGFRFQGTAQAAGPEPCPGTFQPYRGTSDPVTCACAPAAMMQGAVWGTDIYTDDSRICRAALHAGAISRQGGQVTLQPEPARQAWPGSTRNGVQSNDFGPWPAGFSFQGVARRAGPELCPGNFQPYRGSADPITCLCPAEAAIGGTVWGTGTYTDDSAVCRAALHAGAISRMGGVVTVVPAAPQPAYQGSSRNGVRSENYGPWPGAFRFQGAATQGQGSAPVQAPIAETIKRSGQVQLYVTFRTGSAELDIAAAPILMQLRDALAADPALRIRLIGHTDSTGTRPGNAILSRQRADSVRAWLASQGIGPERLDTDGRGQDEPIADNTTDAGRALNRRVQAVRVP